MLHLYITHTHTIWRSSDHRLVWCNRLHFPLCVYKALVDTIVVAQTKAHQQGIIGTLNSSSKDTNYTNAQTGLRDL